MREQRDVGGFVMRGDDRRSETKNRYQLNGYDDGMNAVLGEAVVSWDTCEN